MVDIIKLNKATRNGENEIALFTNLPLEAADALKVAEIYRCRWKIETAFQKLEKYLNSEINTLADPKTAPYGAAARQVLQKQGVWEQLQAKIVRANNLTQTYQFVATGNAELGFIALSQLTKEKLKGSHWRVPQTLYNPIEKAIFRMLY